jgi:hypothetical protein
MNFQAGDFFNLNFNRKQFKTSEGASPRFRLPSCGRFEVEVEVEVAVAVENNLPLNNHLLRKTIVTIRELEEVNPFCQLSAIERNVVATKTKLDIFGMNQLA